MTACKDCKHHVTVGNRHTWHDHVCGAKPRPKEFSPLTGKMEGPYPKYYYIREVNAGMCALFEKLKEKEK